MCPCTGVTRRGVNRQGTEGRSPEGKEKCQGCRGTAGGTEWGCSVGDVREGGEEGGWGGGQRGPGQAGACVPPGNRGLPAAGPHVGAEGTQCSLGR